MELTFEKTGLLKPGEHVFDLVNFEKEFVTAYKFEGSTTRVEIFDNFKEFVDNIIEQGFRSSISKFWIDGSFCTEKLNPSDIDIILFYNPAEFNKKKLEHYIDMNKSRLKHSKKIHIMCINDFSNCEDFYGNETRKRTDELLNERTKRIFKYSKDNIEKGYVIMNSI